VAAAFGGAEYVHNLLSYRLHCLPSRGFEKISIEIRYFRLNDLKNITFKVYIFIDKYIYLCLYRSNWSFSSV